MAVHLLYKDLWRGPKEDDAAAEPGEALHTHVPIFKDSMDASAVHLSSLGEWLADSIFDEQEPAGLLRCLPQHCGI